MAEIFISYARQDRAVAQRLAAVLEEQGWGVFWDRRIEPGAEWNDEIQGALREARCVLVLWSNAAKDSFWVRGEAALAYERDVYLPLCIDGALPPRLFAHVQAASVQEWSSGHGAAELPSLVAAINSRIGPLPMHGNLEKVADGEPVTQAHLHLVHSCWRVDKDTAFGRMPYQIHVILYGHPTALVRVQAVEYHLPGYPPGHEHHRGGSPERLFEMKELANGFSVVQADVHVRMQRKPLRLSRLVNMSENGPRLLDDFLLRSPYRSGLESKLTSLAEAVREASRLLRLMSPDQVRERLVANGTPPITAEAAVYEARGRITP
jgi:hypothetical protein